MSIRDQIKQEVKNIIQNDSEFGEKVIYNGVEINGIVSYGDSAMKGNAFKGDGSCSVAILSIAHDDVMNPETDDSVIINEQTWRVARILSSNFAAHRLQITANESVAGF